MARQRVAKERCSGSRFLLIIRAADTVMPTAISMKISMSVQYLNHHPQVKDVGGAKVSIKRLRRCVESFAPWSDFMHRGGPMPGESTLPGAEAAASTVRRKGDFRKTICRTAIWHDCCYLFKESIAACGSIQILAGS